MKKKNSESTDPSGRLQRNNVYSADAVRDWAWRIHCGPGGIKMNEKFMLVALAGSSNPRGVCELPVRYLADQVGVGMRQAQRIIKKLISYELVSADEVAPQGRPNDVVRKFILHTTFDADTWTPSSNASYATWQQIRKAFNDHLRAALAGNKINDTDFLDLAHIHLVCVRSKVLKFVSPDAQVTKTAFRHQKFIVECVASHAKTHISTIALIPKKGYRD